MTIDAEDEEIDESEEEPGEDEEAEDEEDLDNDPAFEDDDGEATSDEDDPVSEEEDDDGDQDPGGSDDPEIAHEGGDSNGPVGRHPDTPSAPPDVPVRASEPVDSRRDSPSGGRDVRPEPEANNRPGSDSADVRPVPKPRGRPKGSRNRNRTSPEVRDANAIAHQGRLLGDLKALPPESLHGDGKPSLAELRYPGVPKDENGALRTDLSIEEVRKLGAVDLDAVAARARMKTWVLAKLRGDTVKAFSGSAQDKWDAALMVNSGPVGLKITLKRVQPDVDDKPTVTLMDGMTDYADFCTWVRSEYWRGDKEKYTWQIRQGSMPLGGDEINFALNPEKKAQFAAAYQGTQPTFGTVMRPPAPQVATQPQGQQPAQQAYGQPQQSAASSTPPSDFVEKAMPPHWKLGRIAWTQYCLDEHLAIEKARQEEWSKKWLGESGRQPTHEVAQQQQNGLGQPAQQQQSPQVDPRIDRLESTLGHLVQELTMGRHITTATDSITQAQRELAEARQRAAALEERLASLASGQGVVPPQPVAQVTPAPKYVAVGNDDGTVVRILEEDFPTFIANRAQARQRLMEQQAQVQQVHVPELPGRSPFSGDQPVDRMTEATQIIVQGRKSFEEVQRALGVQPPAQSVGVEPGEAMELANSSAPSAGEGVHYVTVGGMVYPIDPATGEMKTTMKDVGMMNLDGIMEKALPAVNGLVGMIFGQLQEMKSKEVQEMRARVELQERMNKAEVDRRLLAASSRAASEQPSHSQSGGQQGQAPVASSDEGSDLSDQGTNPFADN